MTLNTEERHKTMFQDIDKDLLKRFKEFHENNKFVYEEFKNNAFEMRKTGREKYSAWTIINKIRWDQDIKTKGDVFKINNDFIAIYARLLIYHHPQFETFFELREMKKTRRTISQLQQEREFALTPSAQ